MISRFFIDRPIFAAVLSIVVTLAGGIAVFRLPIAQFPNVSPPTVEVSANYPGASAQVVSESIATPIEQQVNGVEGMMYMSSSCTNDGSYALTVTFKQGADLNMAQVLVQNRVALAMPALPDTVKQAGVTVRKRSPDILMAVNIFSPDGSYDQLYLSNYALMQVRDELSRVPGVGDIFIFGQRDYSMRVWVDPEKLAARTMTAGDVVRALREQNLQLSAGAIGLPPTSGDQSFQMPVKTVGRLATPEQFEDVIVKATPNGKLVRIRDVGHVALAPKNQQVSSKVDGRGSVGMGIFQLPDANALETADAIVAKMEELKQSFPAGVDYQISYDTTPYTRESIREVLKTLLEAVALVALVVLLFLQNWRSAIIPLIAVPVAIVGTFAVMLVFHFSLNNLTLFGLVLAIGIVVDDAIVVVEAVEHHIEHGMAPYDAAVKAMQQVSGPVIAVGLVLTAVFVPCAFISGITGMFFRQFALTIAASTVISAFNSLTLSPALAAILLKPRTKGSYQALPRPFFAVAAAWLAWEFLTPWLIRLLAALPEGAVPAGWGAFGAAAPPWAAAAAGAAAGWLLGPPVNALLARSFRLFNRGFEATADGYTRLVGLATRGSAVVLLLYGGMLLLTWFGFAHLPRGFIPSQDMGYLMVSVQLPDSASMERTKKVMDKLSDIAMETPGVKHVSAISGQSFVLSAFGSNFGSMFVLLDRFDRRRAPELYSDAIAAKLRKRFDKEMLDATVAVFPPPPVRGVGRAGGFRIMIEDRGDMGPAMLQGQTEALIDAARRDPRLTGLFTVYRANVPLMFAEVDPGSLSMMEVPTRDATDTLQIYLGSLYVNDFNLFDRTWQVIVQADAPHRDQVEDVARLRVRNLKGQMVPLGALGSVREVNGPLVLTRYNMYPAAAVNGSGGPNVSSGEAIALMQKLAERELPTSMSYEWTEMAYLEVISGNTAMLLFALAVVMVFLVLAAQYESWSLPLAVILVVPMCLLSALAGVWVARQDVNIFTQIGFVVLVGLASKNAILIVEFAKHLREEGGKSRRDATLEACRLRLRPIIMTSLAFILGVVPLLLSNGAGAEMRRTLGTAVFAGMLGVTLFGIFLTPVFFYVVDWLGDRQAFRSPKVQLAGTIALYVVTLGLIGLWGVVITEAVRRRREEAEHKRRLAQFPPDESGAPDGDGNGHAGGGHGIQARPPRPNELPPEPPDRDPV